MPLKTTPPPLNGRLRNLYLEYSGSCNLSCQHCYIFKDREKKARDNKLTPAVVESLVLEAKDLGLQEVTFTGGEIFVRPDLMTAVAACSKHGVTVHLLTNLTIFDQTHLQQLKNLSVGWISTSIDGLEKTHDRFRGRIGSFRKTINNLRSLKNEGFLVKASVTLGQHNIDEAKELFYFLDEQNIPFSLARISPVGRGAKLRRADSNFDQKYTVLLAHRLAQIMDNRGKEIIAAPNEHWIPTYCGVSVDILYITSTGDVGFCPTIAPYIDSRFGLGNVFESPLASIFKSMQSSTRVSPVCSGQKQCSYSSVCRSGCRANVLTLKGDSSSCDTEMFEAFKQVDRLLNDCHASYKVT